MKSLLHREKKNGPLFTTGGARTRTPHHHAPVCFPTHTLQSSSLHGEDFLWTLMRGSPDGTVEPESFKSRWVRHSKVIAGASEVGAQAEVFRFNYMEGTRFEQPGCLAQSPQLYKQMCIMGELSACLRWGRCRALKTERERERERESERESAHARARERERLTDRSSMFQSVFSFFALQTLPNRNFLSISYISYLI